MLLDQRQRFLAAFEIVGLGEGYAVAVEHVLHVEEVNVRAG